MNPKERRRMGLAHEIIYRGMRMSPAWPDRIRAAQDEPTVTLKDETFERFRFGKGPGERREAARPCGDCAVIRGEFHVPGCDLERCPRCRGQLIFCSCNYD
jgi:hypothetical protein